MKNLFEISIEEKNRILEMHINATKKQYLVESTRTLNITVKDEEGNPLVSTLIADKGATNKDGAYTNGAYTDISGKATIEKFIGPSIATHMMGYTDQEITPATDDVNITLVSTSESLKAAIIGARKDFFGRVTNNDGEPIKGAKIFAYNNLKSETEEKYSKEYYSDINGDFNVSRDDYNIAEIEAKGYQKLNDLDISESGTTKDDRKIIKLNLIPKPEPLSLIPPELEYLVGKEFLFLDADRKRPLQGTIETIYYIDDNKLKSIEFTLSNIDAGNTYKLTYNCSQAAFKIKNVAKSASKLKSIVKSIGTFVQDDFLYSTEIKKILGLETVKIYNNIG